MGLFSRKKRQESKVSRTRSLSSALFERPSTTPTPDYGVHLKKIERQRFPRQRNRFKYEENHTVALALPYSNNILNLFKKNDLALLFLSRKYIIEHANRRVDLFFYTLIAYYHTNAIPVEGHTTLQHGKGRSSDDDIQVTQACHSSLIPSLIDQSICAQSRQAIKSVLSNTHFFASLNSTVELPHFVNAFDDLLEAKIRPKCMSILRDVSLGTINPIEGLENFLKLMNELLMDFKTQAASTTHSFFKNASALAPSIQPKLLELVIKGTLATTFSCETDTVNEEYVQLLLRFTPEDKKKCIPHARQEKFYIQKMLEMQEEILKTKSDMPAYSF